MCFVLCLHTGKVKPTEPGERGMMVGRLGFRKKKMPDYKVAYVTMVSCLHEETRVAHYVMGSDQLIRSI